MVCGEMGEVELLEKQWERLSTQTSWRLEPAFQFTDDDAMPNVPDHNSTSSEPITVEPVAADVISNLNSHNDSVQDLEITTPTLAPGAFNTSIENFDTYQRISIFFRDLHCTCTYSNSLYHKFFPRTWNTEYITIRTN